MEPSVSSDSICDPSSGVSIDLPVEDPDEDGARCTICHEAFLCKDPVSLRCGHVYHSECIQKWLCQSAKGDCPQCKSLILPADIHNINFEISRKLPRSLEEVKSLRQLGAEKRLLCKEELLKERDLVKNGIATADVVCEEHIDIAKERKRKRHEAEEAAKELEKGMEAKRLKKEVGNEKTNKLRAEYERKSMRLKQTLSMIQEVRPEDKDAQEERRLQRSGMNPLNRSRALHEAVLEGLHQQQDRAAEFEKRCAELQKAKDWDRKIKKERSELKARLDEVTTASRVASASDGAGSQAEGSNPKQRRLDACETDRAREAVATFAEAMKPTGLQRPPEEDDDDDLLYGARRGKKRGPDGFLAGSARPGTRGGLLKGAPTRPGPPPHTSLVMASVPTPAPGRRPCPARVMFLNKKP